MKNLIIILLSILLLTGCSKLKGENNVEKLNTVKNTEDAVKSEDVVKAEELEKTEAANNESKIVITPIDYTVTQKINKSMPDFTFEILGDNVKTYHEYYSNDSVEITQIKISNKNFKQELIVSTIIPYISDPLYGFSLDDWNFDGYLDISLWKAMGGSMGNEPSHYWLWDSKKNQFIQNDELEQISECHGLSIDNNSKLIKAFVSHGASGATIYYYKYSNGKYLMVKQEEIEGIS